MTFTPTEFLRFLEERQRALSEAPEAGLEAVGERLEREAKAILGTYQREDMGPLAPWAELADRTKDERVRAGYSENDPGLASGVMQESVKHRVEGNTVAIGTDDPHALYFEHGTVKQPPRPFLSLAVWRHGREGIAETIALHPGQVRRREHEELIAATLTARILANAKSGHGCASAVRMYQNVLVELRKSKPEYVE